MKIILMILMIGSSWAEHGVPRHPFDMPFGSEPNAPVKRDSVDDQRLDAMQHDIRQSLQEALARMDQSDGSISPRLRSMLGDPNSTIGQIIAYMFERQQSRYESDLNAMKGRVVDLENLVAGLNDEMKSLMGRVAVKKESKQEAQRRIRAGEPQKELSPFSLKGEMR